MTNIRRISITGAAGFIGRAVVRRFQDEGWHVRALVRNKPTLDLPGVELIETNDLAAHPDLPALLEGCDTVLHLAARVHVVREQETHPDQAFMKANRDLSIRLAGAASSVGVRRFVQMSSVAALGSVTPPGVIIDDASPACPQNAYGRSKLAADVALADLSAKTGLSIACLRPPTVFGPGVEAYFRRLMHCAKLGVPLPIGSFRNKRSFIFVENLADATLAAAHSDAQGAFIVTDSAPRTTAEAYRALLLAYNRPAWLPSMPNALVKAAASTLLGERVDSLLGWSAFDGKRFRTEFRWEAPVEFDRAIAITVRNEKRP